MLQQLKEQFDRQAMIGSFLHGQNSTEISVMSSTAAATAKLDRVVLLKKALLTEGTERTDVMNEVIMSFLQKESKFKSFFPEGSLFSSKDLETVRDGCRLRSANRGETLCMNGEFIEEIFIVISGYIALENSETKVCSFRESGDIIGVDALEKGTLLRKNNVIAATDLLICSIKLDILLRSVGVKISSDASLDPEKFIAKFWKSTGLWKLATQSANLYPLFPFLSPKTIREFNLSAQVSRQVSRILEDRFDGNTSSGSSLSSTDDEKGFQLPSTKTSTTRTATSSSSSSSSASSSEESILDELKKLLSHARLRTYRVGDVVFSQYDYRHYLFIVAKGECAYCRHLPQTEKELAGVEAPHEIDYGLHLFSQDFSFMDGEIADEWITRRTHELENCNSAHSKDKFKRQHPFEQHKNSLKALTFTQICVLPLIDIAASFKIFQELFLLSTSRFQLAAISNKDLILNYAKSMQWKKDQRDVIATTAKGGYHKRRKNRDAGVEIVEPVMSTETVDPYSTRTWHIDDSTHHYQDTALMKAVMNGRMDLVESLLADGIYANIDLRTSDGSTALILAVKRGDQDMAIRIIEAGCDLNMHTDDGCNALIKSSNFGYERIVKSLIAHGANVNEYSKNGNTGLMKACEKGYVGIVEALCKANAKMEIHNSEGCCALIRASNYGHEECVRLLIEYGANINIVSLGGGNTALIKAAEKGYTKIAQLLIEKGIKIDHANKSDVTALVAATKHGHKDICHMIRERQREHIRENGISSSEQCLLRATKEGDEITACCLIRNGSVLVCHYPDGCCPLIKSCNFGYENIVFDLIKYGADINAKSNNGNTGLMKAAEKGYVNIAKALLEAGANIEIHNKEGCCALIRAANYGHEEIVRLLLNFGADINIKSNNGNTALIKAALNGFSSIVTMLIARGADVEIANNAGMTAYDFALKNDHTHIALKIKERLSQLQSKLSVRQSDRSLRNKSTVGGSKNGLTNIGGSKVTMLKGASQLTEKKLHANHSKLNSDKSTSSMKGGLNTLHSDQSTSSIKGDSSKLQHVESSASVVSVALGRGGFKQKASSSALNSVYGQSVQEAVEDLDKMLLYAILGENEAEAIDLIMRGANVDVTFPDGCSPIIKSANYGYENIMSCLLENGVFVDKQSNNGNTALMKSAEKNYPNICASLLAAGASPEIHNNEGCCPMVRACKMGHEEIVRLLVKYNANINEKSSVNGNTGLIKAAEAGHYEIVKFLLENNAALLHANNDGLCALDFAKINNHVHIAQLIERKMQQNREDGQALLDAVLNGDEETACKLIYGGVSLDVGYADGCCPIIKSSNYGYEKIVKALVDMKSDLNKRSNNGNTALIKASEKGFTNIARMLVDAGASINIHSNDGCCALIRSANYGHEDIVRLLIANPKTNIDIKSKNGNTALHKAAEKGFIGIARCLIHKGAKLDIANNTGITPLSYAVKHGHTEIAEAIKEKQERIRLLRGTTLVDINLLKAVKAGDQDTAVILISNGADLNVGYDDGCCPIIKSANFGYERIVKALIANGADLNRKSNNGNTALIKAAEHGYYPIAKALVEANCDMNIHSNDGCCALIRSANYGHLDIVKLLVTNKADINVTSANGNTPLIKASEKGYEEMVRFLVENKAKITITNKMGLSALDFASNNNHTAIYEFLSEKLRQQQRRKKKHADKSNGTSSIGSFGRTDSQGSLGSRNDSKASFGHGHGSKASLGAGGSKASLGSKGSYTSFVSGESKSSLHGSRNKTQDQEIGLPELCMLSSVLKGEEDIAIDFINSGCKLDVSYIDGCNPLIKSSNYGYIRIVEALLMNGCDINRRSRNGNTALMKATENGYTDIAKLLIDSGADLELHSKDGCCALVRAGNYGREDILKMMVMAGANINIRSRGGGNTALMKACEKGFFGIAKFLCDRGANMELHSNDGCCALIRASNYGHFEIVKMMVEKKANIDIVSKNGNTPLIKAADKGYTEIALYLIDMGANVNIVNKTGKTASAFAVLNGSKEIAAAIRKRQKELGQKPELEPEIPPATALKKLSPVKVVDSAAGVNQTSPPGFSEKELVYYEMVKNQLNFGLDVDIGPEDRTLLIAVWYGEEDLAVKLIESGATVNFSYPDGCNPLIKSGNYGYEKVARALLENGANVNVQSKNGNTALMKAAEKNYMNVAKILLEYKPNIEIHNNDGCCALIRASAYGHPDMVRLLLDHSAFIDEKSKNGNTALIKAAEKGFDKIAKLLIDKGADLEVANSAGMTASLLAKRNGHDSIVTYIKERLKQNNLVANALLRAVQNGDERHSVALIQCGAPFENRYPDGCCPIIKSGNFGYKKIIDALIAKGANLNMQSKNGNTALMKACEKGYTDIVRSLMQAGADPELHNAEGCAALIRSANYNNYDCVELLVEFNCNINIRSKNGNTALIKAAANGSVRIVEYLIKMGADLYIANNAGLMALDFATKNNHTDVIRAISDKMRTDSMLTMLLKEGKDIIPMLSGVNLNSRDGHTALLFAIQKGDETTAVALIKGGVDVNQSYADGCAPIIKSSNYGYENIVRALIAVPGINLDKKSNNGNTGLMKASEKGFFRIAEMLVNAGADIGLHSNDGCCALIRASNYGHEDIVRLYVENGADINIKSKNGNTALIKAAEKGFVGIASYLISKEANVNIANNAGKTALIFAMANNHDSIVSMLRARMKALADDRLALLAAVKEGDEESALALIESGSNVHIKYDDGCNPLIKSSHFGYERVVRALVSHGADVNVTSGSGNTALMKAAEANFPRIARILIDAGTDLSLHNNDGCCALVRACNYGSEEIVKMIVEAGGDINIKSRNGNTGLMKATEKGFESIVAYLLERGADATVVNRNGSDAVMIATSNGRKVIVDMLKKALKSGTNTSTSASAVVGIQGAANDLLKAMKKQGNQSTPVQVIKATSKGQQISSGTSVKPFAPSPPKDERDNARRSSRPYGADGGRFIRGKDSSSVTTNPKRLM